jgi:diadenosine tetraphosphatase ApaH/serine/threonine PP2A family protein phosphatase
VRVAVVSDVHSNLVALRAVLDHAGPVDSVWCLGDTVGYGPEPEACVRTLNQRPHVAVAGNHDWAAIGRLGTEDFNAAAATALHWTIGQLSPEAREYLELLPQRRVEGEFTLVHGSPRDPIWEYLLSARAAAANFDYFATRYCLVGHTHVPSYFLLRDGRADVRYVEADYQLDLADPARFILNPGSVGQPRDDNPHSSYLLLDTKKRVATWRRVPYDIAATQLQMAEHGLPRPLIERLAGGW